MNDLKFTKLTGQGNDFILVDSVSRDYNLSGELIERLCNRNFGIGADGLILVEDSSSADFQMKYYNKDGSEAEMCGNGIRCMAYFINYKGLSVESSLRIETLAGIKEISLKWENNRIDTIKVNMGKAVLKPDLIPVDTDLTDSKKKKRLFDYKLYMPSEGIGFAINTVSMGNPHCIIFLDEDTDIKKIPLDKWGPLIENHKIFPNKTNVEFLKIISKEEISMRVWERGVGETLACGTGACASAVCSWELNKTEGDIVKVNLPGGRLYISKNYDNDDIFLEGRVLKIFDGIIDLDLF